MRDKLIVCLTAAIAAILTIISSVFDIVIADRVDDQQTLSTLLYAAVVLQFIALGGIIYFTIIFAGQRKDGKARVPWINPVVGAGYDVVTLLVTGVGIVWFTTKYGNGIAEDFRLSAVGLTAWTLGVLMHGIFFALLTMKIRKLSDADHSKVMATDILTKHSSQKELASDARSSYYSRDTTQGSRSPTPPSPRTHSLHSSAAKNTIRSKFGRHSAKSSLDTPALPDTETSVLNTAFDRYDTSNVDSDVRNTVLGTQPTMTRPGLETIPGSRPNSPGDTLSSEAMLPTSPKCTTQAQTTPEKVKRGKNNSSPNSKNSSPPNFSRPTSRSKHQPTMSGSSHALPLRSPRPAASMTDLIHPLFRPDSPSPPQILTSGTMVTASPLANQPITPKTLSRLRSSSDLHRKPSMPTLPNKTGLISSTPFNAAATTGQWRVMPSIDISTPSSLRQRSKSHASILQRPQVTGSTAVSTAVSETCDEFGVGIPSSNSKTNPDADTFGSPGPSIMEEDELPPILPGFVLSAGSRTSLVGYGKRKSVKKERSSVASFR